MNFLDKNNNKQRRNSNKEKILAQTYMNCFKNFKVK